MANGVSNSWPTLFTLKNMPEAQRRRVLRLSRDTVARIEPGNDLRVQLDGDLWRLGALELRAETTTGDSQRQAMEEIAAVNAEFAELIQKSPAFAHYLNSCLYFKIRFAAGRFGNPCAASANAAGQDNLPELQLNERAIGLPTPPPCEGLAPYELNEDVERFISLRNSAAAEKALEFLDDRGAEEIRKFDLWVRGLLPGQDHDELFRQLARGLYEWAFQRYEFYLAIERRQGRGHRVDEWLRGPRVEGYWHARNPLSARCAVFDLYWLARILRAEVTPRGVVSYVGRSWLHYLPSVSEETFPKEQVLLIEEVLRSVFGYACELIQNAVEMAEYCENKAARPADFPQRPDQSEDWRAAFDREFEEIGNHRLERMYSEHLSRRPVTATEPGGRLSDRYWTKRIRTGEHEENLVGVAISGGGIRSATFALGVLQHLRDLDLLMRVDYLSTVSGGGYIGAWLVGNVRRTRYWLSRMTSWDESIGHLRRYSKYLAPQSGFLSADSWVIWGTWIRNALLIQLTAVAWMAALLVASLAWKAAFDWSGSKMVSDAMHLLLAATFIILASIIGVNLRKPSWSKPTQHRVVILLAWLSSFLTAALVWTGTSQRQDYSYILKMESRVWPWYISPCLFLSMLVLALVSVGREKKLTFADGAGVLRFLGAVSAASLSAGVIYLTLCGVAYLFGVWTSLGRDQFGWYAYVFGPALVLLGTSLAVVVFIGLVGSASADWRREWWTRYGAGLALYGSGFLALSLAAVFGHVLLTKLFALGEKVKWGAVAGWIASVIAGLLAGNSTKTKGNGENTSNVLEWVAHIGGVLFIVGAVLALSAVLPSVLSQIWLDNPPMHWWENLNQLLVARSHAYRVMPLTLVALLIGGSIFSWRFNLNIFGLNQFYRNRLVRCYLGATRWKPGWRRPDRFTGFDEDDDLNLADLQFESPRYSDHFRGPFPILNCALNLGGSSDLEVKTRQSASFTMTPLNCGSARARIGYAPLRVQDRDGFAGGVSLGEAISISGAAASPNMGYNTSPLVSILLTMFNVRLAWWFPNPGRKKWRKGSSPISILYLVEEFMGLADETSHYVNVSDGGHFENLGIYELIRRRAKVIIASDAECDPTLSFGSLGNLIRICGTDFGARIELDVESIRKQENGRSRAHCAVGRITYSNGSLGYLIYLKASITGDEDPAIEQYRALHPDFPHQSTGDQFFTEDQFESYRRLGRHITRLAFRDAESAANVVELASKLYDVWTPAGFSNDTFVEHAKHLDVLWDRFRTSEKLGPLLKELMADRTGPLREGAPDQQELSACLELTQLMENVILNLRLDDFWDHPDNRGWAMLFSMWAKSATFRAAWKQIRRTYGIRFEYFCEQHLGLEAEHPVVRV